jgi:hypothetical protein
VRPFKDRAPPDFSAVLGSLALIEIIFPGDELQEVME